MQKRKFLEFLRSTKMICILTLAHCSHVMTRIVEHNYDWIHGVHTLTPAQIWTTFAVKESDIYFSIFLWYRVPMETQWSLRKPQRPSLKPWPASPQSRCSNSWSRWRYAHPLLIYDWLFFINVVPVYAMKQSSS